MTNILNDTLNDLGNTFGGLATYRPAKINAGVSEILESIEVCDDFEQLARFRLNQLTEIKAAVKKISAELDARMIALGGQYDDGQYKIVIGKKTEKSVNALDALGVIDKNTDSKDDFIFIIKAVLSMSKGTIKPAEYKKFVDSAGVEDDAYTETVSDVVQVKEINKKFLKQ